MALRTKKALAESLCELLSKRTLDRITVRDIVENCGVNRQTFYYHFHDVYDLLEWIFEDMMEGMLKERDQYDDWTQGIEYIVAKMLENRKLILNAYHSVSHEAVSQFVKRWLEPYAAEMVEREAEGLSVAEEDKAFVVKLFTLSTTGFFTEWVEHHLSEQQLGDLKKIKVALDGSARTILLRFAQNDMK